MERLDDLLNTLMSETQEEQPREQPQERAPDRNETQTTDIIKKSVIQVASYPMPYENDKRRRFEDALNNDNFINEYLEKQINKYLVITNEHMRAGITYAYHYNNIRNSL